MGKISLIIKRRECMGCHACEIACKQEHNLPTGPRLVRVIEKAPDFIPVYCHHCANAPCMESCPEKAVYKNELGVVLIKEELCIGCMACVEACPFGAMQFFEDRNVAVKCDLCIHRISEGEGPACASVCPTGCIMFGDTKGLLDRMAAP
ncbi:MAG: 4Fe-4S dicluster domain-containing protein [Desulfatiglandales bacterium]